MKSVLFAKWAGHHFFGVFFPCTRIMYFSRRSPSYNKVNKVNTDIAVRNRNYHTATGNHMPYGITQCYLPPGSGDFPAEVMEAHDNYTVPHF